MLEKPSRISLSLASLYIATNHKIQVLHCEYHVLYLFDMNNADTEEDIDEQNMLFGLMRIWR